MTFKTQISSSSYLVNFQCVREMRNMKEIKCVKEIIKLELEKEETWSKVMNVLLRVFKKHQTNNSKIALPMPLVCPVIKILRVLPSLFIQIY